MPIYTGLRTWKIEVPADKQFQIEEFTKSDKKRTAKNLKRIQAEIRRQIPLRTEDNLLLATWNIRDFGAKKSPLRLKETYYYIAEIISAFDVVAVQEVNEDIRAFEAMKRILGYGWDYISTDKTEGRSGNNERMVFLYNKEKVWFKGIAGEIVLPDTRSRMIKYIKEDKKDKEGKKQELYIQFARTPFMVGFQAAWFKFKLCTVHIYYGEEDEKTEEFKRRVREIGSIAKEIRERQVDDSEYRYVLLGDFNIVHPEHKTMKALSKKGFFVPMELRERPSNYKKDMHYDQIAFKCKNDELKLSEGIEVEQKDGQIKTVHAGVFEFFDYIFRETKGDFRSYRRFVKTRKPDIADDNELYKEYKEWRTYQMSDHFPMWVELKIDFSGDYLRKISPDRKKKEASG